MDLGITDNIVEFHLSSRSDPNHRFRSWEHCYCQFKKARKTAGKTDFDYLALHLAFYLASWGMYRGSSQLLQKDYRVHLGIVREVQKPKYHILNSLTAKSILTNGSTVEILFELTRQLKSNYEKHRVTPTDTLITKVLMGVYGAVPAYDNYFLQGLHTCHIWDENRCPKKITKTFNMKSVIELAEFYENNRDEFSKAYKMIGANRSRYPQMKLVDSYFWTIGYSIQGGLKGFKDE